MKCASEPMPGSGFASDIKPLRFLSSLIPVAHGYPSRRPERIVPRRPNEIPARTRPVCALRILIVDDDAFYRDAAKLFLVNADASLAVEEAETGEAGLACIRDTEFDCVLLDFRLPDMNGLEFLNVLKSDEVDQLPPIVMLTGNGDEAIAVSAIKRGATDYLSKQHSTPDQLVKAVRNAVAEEELRRDSARSLKELEQLALTDPLTGLGNRNHFEMRFAQALRRSRRMAERLCLLVIDLDSFKGVNDTHGHVVGDKVLGEVGRRLAEAVRDSDCVARIGGDEFVVLMETGATVDGAEILATRIETSVAEPFRVDGLTLTIGASVGLSMFPQDGETVEDLLRAADAAMYNAKRATARDLADVPAVRTA